MSLQPFTRRKLASALSMPAATQRLTILPSRHRFTFLLVERQFSGVPEPSRGVTGAALQQAWLSHPLHSVRHVRICEPHQRRWTSCGPCVSS